MTVIFVVEAMSFALCFSEVLYIKQQCNITNFLLLVTRKKLTRNPSPTFPTVVINKRKDHALFVLLFSAYSKDAASKLLHLFVFLCLIEIVFSDRYTCPGEFVLCVFAKNLIESSSVIVLISQNSLAWHCVCVFVCVCV